MEADPLEESMIAWQRVPTEDEPEMTLSLSMDSKQGFDRIPLVKADQMKQSNSRLELSLSGRRASLTINNVTTADSGLYLCVVANGIGRPTNASNRLVVKQAPVMRLLPSVYKSASDSGSVGRLVCRVSAAPDVHFSWSKDEQLLASESSVGFSHAIPTAVEHLTSNGVQISDLSVGSSSAASAMGEKYVLPGIRQIGLYTYESTLLIHEVNPLDYGLYGCRAHNALGSAAGEIQFGKPGRPDRPLALRAVNRTAVSVSLHWIAGFDGGLSQRFRLRFKPTSGSYLKASFNFLDVDSSKTRGFTVTGLRPGTEYTFAIQAINALGESEYTSDLVKESTLDGRIRF